MGSESRANGKNIGYTWDNLDRLTSRTSGGVGIGYGYDEFQYGVGHLTSFSDPTGQTLLYYDSNGSAATQDSLINGAHYVVRWSHDAAERLATMTYPSGLVLTYAYDSIGRVSSITSNAATSPTLANGFLYQPATSQMYAYVSGNGLVHATTLDTDGRITTVASPGAGVFYDNLTDNTDNTVNSYSDTVHTANTRPSAMTRMLG